MLYGFTTAVARSNELSVASTLGKHDQCGELNELAIACYSRKCLLFNCYLIMSLK